MIDETKEMSNEENEVSPEQPAVEEETAVVEEVLPEGAIPQSCDETQPPIPVANEPPAAVDAPVQQDDTAGETPTLQTEESGQTAEPESTVQVGEALVEMIDAPTHQDGGQTPDGDEQPAEELEASELQPPASEQSLTIESVVEAILFASDEPLQESRLAGIVETTAKQIRECVESLNARYEAHGNAFCIEQIAGGYQMLTQPIYNSWLQKMVRIRSDNKLSPAAMETLAIIAYKQPIIRADIEAIRGVAVGEVIRSLMYKGLVKIAGRAEILGRPMLYGTTKKFLEIFGLNSIKDLPKAEDLKNPDRG